MASKIIKESTRLTGLAVAKNPHHTLGVLYGKLNQLLDKMPNDAAYKKHTKQIVDERLKLVQTVKDVPTLEKQINSGQIEEVIKEAEYELSLARRMVEWKPWEKLVAQPPKDQWTWPPY